MHGALINGNSQLQEQPPRSVNTYAYASFSDFGDQVPPVLNEHLEPASHEILEWLDDPLVFNANASDPLGASAVASIVPTWRSPFYRLGCSSVYEVADPLEYGGPAIGVPRSGQIDLFANVVFQSWFARTASTSIGDRYDLGGVFQSPSEAC